MERLSDLLHNVQCIFNDCIEIRSRDDVEYVSFSSIPVFPLLLSSDATTLRFPTLQWDAYLLLLRVLFPEVLFLAVQQQLSPEGGERGASGSGVWPTTGLNCCTLDGKERLKRISISVRLCFFLREDKKMRNNGVS